MRVQADGSVNVDGTVAVRDLNRQMDWDLPDEEATTIAGLVIHEAQTIPEPGQAFTFYGYRFEILRKSRNKITAIRIKPIGAADKRAGRTSRATRWRRAEARATQGLSQNSKCPAVRQIDCVVFDIGNVLVRWDPRNLYRRMGYPDAATT